MRITFFILITVLWTGLYGAACTAKPDAASLFPISTESPDYQDGFRAGFYEGLTYNQITP